MNQQAHTFPAFWPRIRRTRGVSCSTSSSLGSRDTKDSSKFPVRPSIRAFHTVSSYNTMGEGGYRQMQCELTISFETANESAGTYLSRILAKDTKDPWSESIRAFHTVSSYNTMGEGGYRQINKTLNVCAFDDYSLQCELTISFETANESAGTYLSRILAKDTKDPWSRHCTGIPRVGRSARCDTI
jgi:hypothetical protein